jgi:aerobic-type carbon monoxide dehydrogenase small subunit (CoxS/CutS family)
MQNILEKTAEGTANPLQKWYATAHSNQCGCCQRELTRLKSAKAK